MTVAKLIELLSSLNKQDHRGMDYFVCEIHNVIECSDGVNTTYVLTDGTLPNIDAALQSLIANTK